MVNTSNTGPNPGDTNSTAQTQTPIAEVYGTPGNGKVPQWNTTTGRFEWADLSGTSGTTLTEQGAWVTSHAYAVGDVVTQSNIRYVAAVAHTSGTFATDLAGGKWIALDAIGIPTQTGASGQFLSTNGSVLSWAPLALTGYYDVRSYGAKCDGRAVYDAATTNASATVTSATAAFTAADTGKIAQVEKTDGTVVGTGTVTYVNATTITLSNNATATASGCTLNIGTDDTAAVQSAIAAAVAAGGGTVYFPPGITLLNGAQVTGTVGYYTYSGQLTIPARSPAQGQITVRFLGPTPAPQSFWDATTGDSMPAEAAGCAIIRSFASSGNILDCIPSSSVFSSFYRFTNVQVVSENLIWRSKNNPGNGGVNVNAAISAQILGSTVGVDGNFANTVAPSTATAIGLNLPQINNAAGIQVDRSQVYGYGTGISHCEWTFLNNTHVQHCLVGIAPVPGNHPSWYTGVGIQFMPAAGFGISPTGASPVLFGSVSFEHGASPYIEINDPNSWLKGRLNYFRGPTAGNVLCSGVANIGLSRVDTDAPTNLHPATPLTDALNNTSRANTLVIGQTDTGYIWYYPNGTWGIGSDGGIRCISNALGTYVATVDYPTNPTTPTVKATIKTGAVKTSVGLVGQHDGSNTYLAFVYENDGFVSNTVFLYKFVAGVRTQLATAALTLTAATSHAFEMDITATTVTCKVDGSTVLGPYTLSAGEQTNFNGQHRHGVMTVAGTNADDGTSRWSAFSVA